MREDQVGEGRLFEPDIMLPAQYFAVLRKSAPQGPEYQLVLAMLQDAIECFQKYHFAVEPRGRELYEEARDWIMSEDRSWPFSFENVCMILRLEPSFVRNGLVRWAERAEAARRSGKLVPFTPAAARAVRPPAPMVSAVTAK